MAEAATVLDYSNNYYYGSAAPAIEVFEEPDVSSVFEPTAEELAAAKARSASQSRVAPSISLFSWLGSAVVGILMVFVVLAYINYNEVASETLRLNNQLDKLAQEERRLEIEFESVVDIKAVEQYARDVLGMSKPDVNQVVVIQSKPEDKAEVLRSGDDNSLREFGSFLSSLLDYFKK